MTTSLGEVIEGAALARARDDGEDRPLSSREIGRRSARHTDDGRELHWNTVNLYRKDRYSEVRTETLAVIAAVLATDAAPAAQLLRQMQAAVGMLVGEGTRYTPPRGSEGLNVAQRRVIDATINVFLETNQAAAAKRPGDDPR